MTVEEAIALVGVWQASERNVTIPPLKLLPRADLRRTTTLKPIEINFF
jgi:hypothetical protein